MYVATKGGEAAIAAAHEALAQKRAPKMAASLTIAQIKEQLSFAVSRVMAEGSLHDADVAALAIKQAQGDLIEAIFLVRAYRSTLPRFGVSEPVDTGAMLVDRRISATFKDIPGGQVLGPTFDYTHRLLDFSLLDETETSSDAPAPAAPDAVSDVPDEPAEPMPRLTDLLDAEGLIEPDGAVAEDGDRVRDITRQPITYPAERDVRLQRLARGDEGFLLGLGYSSQRGFGRTHPFVGELRVGSVVVELDVPECDGPIEIGEIDLTECQTVNQFSGSKKVAPQFTRGYGLAFGQSERKAMAMALVDRSLRDAELGQEIVAPVQDQEFVLAHADNIEATGFVEHLKLPHYVDFQAELDLLRRLRAEALAAATQDAGNGQQPDDGADRDAEMAPEGAAEPASPETTRPGLVAAGQDA